MAAAVLEVLKANLMLVGVGLLTEQEEFESFVREVAVDVSVAIGLSPNNPTGMPEPLRKIVLNRDRIEIETSLSWTSVSRDYPEERDLERLSAIAGLAIAKTYPQDRPSQPFGFNIELVYRQDSGEPAHTYLADRLFAESLADLDQWELVGGSGRLVFQSDDAVWTIQLEPRANDETATRVSLRLNMHKDSRPLPDQDEILKSLREAWKAAYYFVSLLDESN